MRSAAALAIGVAALAVVPHGIAAASPANAATAIIGPPVLTDGVLTFPLSTGSPQSSVGFDPGSVAVSFLPFRAEEPVPLDVVSTDTSAAVRQTVVLVVDTSGSLRQGGGIDAVRDAALAFVDAVPDSTALGLVTFGQPPDPVVAPTTDHDTVRAELEDIEAAGGTALYDAVVQGVLMLPDEGVSRLVVLTDGTDESAAGDGSPGSRTSPEQAAVDLSGSGAQVVPIAFTARADTEALAALAGVPEAAVVDAADDAELQEVFASAATAVGRDLSVRVAVPDGLVGRSGDLLVTAELDGTPVRASRAVVLAETLAAGPGATAPAPSAPASQAPATTAPDTPYTVLDSAAPAVSGTPPVVLGAALAVGLALLVGVAVGGAALASGTSPQARRRRSLAAHTVRPGGAGTGAPSARTPVTQSTVLGDNVVARSAVGLANRVVRRRGGSARLARDLDAANLPLRPAEWLVLQVLVAAGAALALLAVSAGEPLAGLLGLVLGIASPPLFLSVRRERRRRAFVQALPDTLNLMASGLRAGFSVPQAMESVVNEGQEPLRTELGRALVEAQLGVPPEEALDHVASRMRSRDFRWVVMSMRIQRQVGGNLSEVLDTVGATIRERARLQRQVDALSAEGRLSAWIVGLLPVAFTLYIVVAQPGYLRPLLTDPVGLALLLLGAVLFAVGVVALRWATRVDV